jgi:hypothetical protein
MGLGASHYEIGNMYMKESGKKNPHLHGNHHKNADNVASFPQPS